MQRARPISRRGKTGLENRQTVPKNRVWVITGSTVFSKEWVPGGRVGHAGGNSGRVGICKHM